MGRHARCARMLRRSVATCAQINMPRDMYTQLSVAQRDAFERLCAASNASDATRVWDACGGVKQVLAPAGVSSVSDALRDCAYDALLRQFAADGAYAAAAATVDDMKRVRASVDVHKHDMVLAAAAATGDLVLVQEALSNYDSGRVSDSDVFAEARVAMWTSATVEHVLRYCRVARNLELALLVIHATEKRIGLTDAARTHFVECAIATGEPRIAYEFVRRLPGATPAHWIAVLRGAAEFSYAPALGDAWDRATDAGFVPDEGLCNHMLSATARSGQYEIADAVMARMTACYGADVLREWHLSPLFAAHCVAFHFDGAARALALMKSRGISPGPDATLLIGAAQRADMLAAAIEAVLAVDAPVEAYTALIYACAEQESLVHARRVFAAALGASAQVDTFNAMLQVCLVTGDVAAAEETWRLLSASHAPGAASYERMIRIYLRGDAYEAAFELLEACKERGIVPTRRTYAAMIWTCWRRGDPRADILLQEMLEAGYEPAESLRNALGINNDDCG